MRMNRNFTIVLSAILFLANSVFPHRKEANGYADLLPCPFHTLSVPPLGRAVSAVIESGAKPSVIDPKSVLDDATQFIRHLDAHVPIEMANDPRRTFDEMVRRLRIWRHEKGKWRRHIQKFGWTFQQILLLDLDERDLLLRIISIIDPGIAGNLRTQFYPYNPQRENPQARRGPPPAVVPQQAALDKSTQRIMSIVERVAGLVDQPLDQAREQRGLILDLLKEHVAAWDSIRPQKRTSTCFLWKEDVPLHLISTYEALLSSNISEPLFRFFELIGPENVRSIWLASLRRYQRILKTVSLEDAWVYADAFNRYSEYFLQLLEPEWHKRCMGPAATTMAALVVKAFPSLEIHVEDKWGLVPVCQEQFLVSLPRQVFLFMDSPIFWDIFLTQLQALSLKPHRLLPRVNEFAVLLASFSLLPGKKRKLTQRIIGRAKQIVIPILSQEDQDCVLGALPSLFSALHNLEINVVLVVSKEYMRIIQDALTVIGRVFPWQDVEIRTAPSQTTGKSWQGEKRLCAHLQPDSVLLLPGIFATNTPRYRTWRRFAPLLREQLQAA